MQGLLELSDSHRLIVDLLTEQLGEVSRLFERQLASDLSAVNALCLHIEQYRGKMLRPTLVLLSGLAAGGAETSKRRNVKTSKGSDGDGAAALDDRRAICTHSETVGSSAVVGTNDCDVLTFGRFDVSPLTDRHRTVAAVVEMIHMATLVHDDVLDEADVRRRGKTVNHLWGNETAVMLGDYLISNAFHLCSTLGDPAINLALGHVTNTLCEGELVQLHHRDDYGIDEATYFEIVTRKTASLIGECCRLGAALTLEETSKRPNVQTSKSSSRDAASSLVSEHSELGTRNSELPLALRRFGVALGIAFQIQDDLLDLIGDDRVVGKSLGKDLDKGKLTLPLTRYMASVDQAGRGEALRLIERRDAHALRSLLIESGAVESTRQTALEYVEAAKAELVHIPTGPAANLLATLADQVVSRSH